MEILICGAEDVPDLVTLFVEMEGYYFGHGAISHEEMSTYLAEKVFSAYSGVTVIGARRNGVFVGFATFTLMFPAPLCSGQAFMKELFISEAARGQGIGKSLIRFIATFALKQGCSRLDWTTDTSNPKAGMFYFSLGATQIKQKQYFRLEGKKLETFSLGV
ncbi:GNAT family N-acetyltransferase [Enterobacter hormaechei]|uniref:GNAT family N-acetyltransferase n=1 Tax=Enterobacter hormaechei TaxID=158836 RepID=UPI0013D0AE19|nr:GNAT family N-acetyltransferase [Enterobacter hormaechei]